MKKGSRIIVVGAGFAGFGAAARLVDAGFNVEIIEARNRTGGRAHTLKLGGYPVDMGASWLQRGKHNYLLGEAEKRSLIIPSLRQTHSCAWLSGTATEWAYAEGSRKLQGPLLLPYFSHRFKKLLGIRPRTPSVEAWLGKKLHSLGPVGASLGEAMRNTYAADLDDLAGHVLFVEPDSERPNPEVKANENAFEDPTVVDGMQALHNALTPDYPIALDEKVEIIKRTSEGVSLKTAKRTIDADGVVVTVPIGVLKNGGVKFDPPLPAQHRKALSGLKMGSSQKLWLRYPEGSWDGAHQFEFFCDEPNFRIKVDFLKSNEMPIFLGFASGADAVRANELGPDKMAEEFHKSLRKYVRADLPDPVDYVMSAWDSDPFASGAYMYPSVTARAGDHLLLRAPIADKIFLAGEALAEAFGYVDTAWHDGERAAALIINGA